MKKRKITVLKAQGIIELLEVEQPFGKDGVVIWYEVGGRRYYNYFDALKAFQSSIKVYSCV